MPAFDVFPTAHPLNYGFLGGNGHKFANLIAAKSDLIITIGSRMCIRQIGLAREKFAPDAKLIRIDIDKDSMTYKVHNDEVAVEADLKVLLPQWKEVVKPLNDYSDWKKECDIIKAENDQSVGVAEAQLLKQFSKLVPADYDVTLDVGLNQLLCAVNFEVKEGQHVYMSAGHGAMGYSLPAAIGISTCANKSVVSFCGDGGLMMNVQELQYLKREQLPVKIVCITMEP
jgi:acetolactate synthase-1/2/3 large subunit